MKVQDVMNAMERIAPPELALPGDFVGLIAGAPTDEATGILICVDVTHKAIDSAMACGADVIVAHHRLLYAGAYTLRADDYEGGLLTRLVRAGIALYAAHTNLDSAEDGVEDCLAHSLGMAVDVRERFVRVGNVEETCARDYVEGIRRSLSPQAVFYGDADAVVTRVCASCGGGGSDFGSALVHGAQLFVTGEMRHHERVEAVGRGLSVLLLGHEESEQVVLDSLRARLAQETGLPVTI